MSVPRQPQHHQRPQGNPHLPAAAGVRRAGPHQEPAEYEKLCAAGRGRPRGLLGRAGRSRSRWFASRGTRVLDWNEPHAKWFVGGKLNASDNCLDRHLDGPAPQQGGHHLGGRARRQPRADLPGLAPRGLQVRQRPQGPGRQAGRPRDDLHADGAGAAIAMLACARIGATHTVVFGGFSAEAVADRNNDAKAEAGHHRRRRLAARQGRAAQGERRRGAGEVADASRSASSSTAATAGRR